ncbi:hypothetical protein [Puia dinghuensis]|nr:hypothetical protein [Puia dinghuensis]
MYYPTRTVESFNLSKNDYMSLGPTPASEPCVQIGEDISLSIAECKIYMDQLLRRLGNPPDGCNFFLLKNYHDFGTYYEAAVCYDPENEQALDYALKAEAGDDRWDELARQQIIEKGIVKAKRA